MTSQELKAAAKSFGADLVGIASTASLAYLPKEDNPLSIFPQAKNVIIIGRKIPRGALRGIEQGTEMDNSFAQFGFIDLEDNFLAKTTYDVNIWMEARGLRPCRCSRMTALVSRWASQWSRASPRRTLSFSIVLWRKQPGLARPA